MKAPSGWNLSPWGDGNALVESNTSLVPVEIYPREGTETAESRPRRTARVEIYPREGTETADCSLSSQWYGVVIYPREGMETYRHTRTRQNNQVEIYPREGTEAVLYKYKASTCLRWNLSLWGDGNDGTASSASSQRVETYPREGTETSWVWWNVKKRLCLDKRVPVRGRKLLHLFVWISFPII